MLFNVFLCFSSFLPADPSFDVRDKESRNQPRHWSAPEVFGSRAKFHFESQPATLEIKVRFARGIMSPGPLIVCKSGWPGAARVI